ncbi:MAG: methyltransferase domain-containing protein [Candidatus Bipolaricaulia bacterium]
MSSENYSKFAQLYSSGSYPQYSRYIAGKFPDILGKLRARPSIVLDLACGEGTFAVELAKLGYQATGIDKSEEMIDLARDNAEEEGVDVTFFQQDMRELSLDGRFDFVTSWFDSMNYLLTRSDFRETLGNVHELLREGGYFVFDVNTIHGLSVQWQEHDCYVQRDDSSVFELHRTGYDRPERIARLTITFFVNNGSDWEKHEEVHLEKGYELDEIEEMARSAGFVIPDVWSDLENFDPPEDDSGRVWFALKKAEG